MTDKDQMKFVQLWTKDRLHGFDDDSQAKKILAHKLAKKVLTNFATEFLGLTKGQFEVGSNMGGIAVSGEVTLYTDPFGKRGIYIQVSQSSVSGVMFRTTESRKDYLGGPNHWAEVRHLVGIMEAVKLSDSIKQMVK